MGTTSVWGTATDQHQIKRVRYHLLGIVPTSVSRYTIPATRGGGFYYLRAFARSLSKLLVDDYIRLGSQRRRWSAHMCIGVPLTYCVLFRSHRTRTLDGVLSMLRRSLSMEPSCCRKILLLLTSSCQSWSALGTSQQWSVKPYADPRNNRASKKTRANGLARKGANLFCSTLESALSRFQSRTVFSTLELA